MTTDVRNLRGLQVRQYKSIKKELSDQIANTLDGSVFRKVTRTSDSIDPKDITTIKKLPADAILMGNIKELVSLGGENKAGLTAIQVEYKLIDIKTGLEVITAINRSTTDLDKVAMAQVRVLAGLLNKAKTVTASANIVEPLPSAQATPVPSAGTALQASPVASPQTNSPASPNVGTAPLMSLAEAQQILIDLKLLKGTADGKMGKNTADALKRFQQANGIPQTGKLEPNTISKLYGAKRS